MSVAFTRSTAGLVRAQLQRLRTSHLSSTPVASLSVFALRSSFSLCASSRLYRFRQTAAAFSTSAIPAKDVTVTFIEPDGNEVKATGEEGTNLMELAHENDVDLEGACEGACACSTCHVILPDNIYDRLPEPSDEENDMLDLAFGLTDTSRLGCQVMLSPEMEGMRIKLPSATRNFYVDGAKPSHH
ncbi:ferredoxin [Coemansia reversa NRRL 1564]|uniref:2Fe-2S ferredoxin n=1 Tax=Coemansia reversa (strain ATCC 12441 / NRRL 1564) TaxID=763665 RepID=A0A2G5B4T1_COERN|nr:ferredoxin [Coemansia reversa NRRL 1564]|eukprot:PIA14001.1 ferredoxin [Coemansia reversa NRRL 1564]